MDGTPRSHGKRRSASAVVAAAGIGIASSAVGYWIGPATVCPDLNTPGSQYCGLNWWLGGSHLVVSIGGVVAGALLGMATRVWITAVAGIVLGNIVGPVLGLWIAIQSTGHDTIFGEPPMLRSPLIWVAVFSVVGAIAFTIGWALVGWARRTFVAVGSRLYRRLRGAGQDERDAGVRERRRDRAVDGVGPEGDDTIR